MRKSFRPDTTLTAAAAALLLAAGFTGLAPRPAAAQETVRGKVTAQAEAVDDWGLFRGHERPIIAQQKQTSEGFAYANAIVFDPEFQPERITGKAFAAGSATSGTMKAQASAHARVISNVWDPHSASASVTIEQLVGVEGTGGLGTMQPLSVFLDGSLFASNIPDWAADEFAYGSANLGVEIYGRGGLIAQESWSDYRSSDEDAVPREDYKVVLDKPSLWLYAPAGRTEWYTLRFSLSVNAVNGWDADFGSTAHIYMPETGGVKLTTFDGFLSEQSRPAWAQPQQNTEVPEPGTTALVGAGVLPLLGAVARRRRRD